MSVLGYRVITNKTGFDEKYAAKDLALRMVGF